LSGGVDIFVSYAREDRAQASALAALFSAHGWSVWWDAEIRFGRPFDEVIQRVLDSARCVVVLWSEYSISSTWVKAEAKVALDRDILLPVLLGNVRAPLPFGQIHSAELWEWKEGSNHPEMARLLQQIRGLLGAPAPAPPPGEPPPRVRPVTSNSSPSPGPHGSPTAPSAQSRTRAQSARPRISKTTIALLTLLMLI